MYLTVMDTHCSSHMARKQLGTLCRDTGNTLGPLQAVSFLVLGRKLANMHPWSSDAIFRTPMHTL